MGKLAIVVPCYHWISTSFFSNFVMLDGIGSHAIAVSNGVYLTAAMQKLLDAANEANDWERLLIIEQDMILPRDALTKHAAYTEPIVGSMYFRHEPPHHPIIASLDRQGELQIPFPLDVERMLKSPRLYPMSAVGMGCTSIRRDVLESWPKDKPIWELGKTSDGTVVTSHDYYFCLEAGKHGFKTYVDSSLICRHLTEDATSPMHYMAAIHTGYAMEQTRQDLVKK